MTVAVWGKINDGIALATDSATTGYINGQAQVYNNADKIFQLHRDLPIAAMTWGDGQVGPASIATISKGFRLHLMGREGANSAWTINPSNYTVEAVARSAAGMFCEAYAGIGQTSIPGALGYLIAGYSAGNDQPEVWLLKFQGDELCPEPTEVASIDTVGYEAYAQPDAVNRLFRGYDDQLLADLKAVIDVEGHPLIESVLNRRSRQPVLAPMPLADAIELAKFLVKTTSGYTHFVPGPDTVGGPVEVASINLHEGFKWISRKHYFRPELNRGEQ